VRSTIIWIKAFEILDECPNLVKVHRYVEMLLILECTEGFLVACNAFNLKFAPRTADFLVCAVFHAIIQKIAALSTFYLQEIICLLLITYLDNQNSSNFNCFNMLD
jgi:hypothetical protein